MIKKMKKFIILSLAVSSIGGTVALAATAQPDGEHSYWVYGGGNEWFRTYAFSNYYHGKKQHSSTVISRDDGSSAFSGVVGANQTSYAKLYTDWGEKAAFYYNHK